MSQKQKNRRTAHPAAVSMHGKINPPRHFFQVVAAILALACVVMSPTFQNSFVSYDDFAYVTENALIRDLSWNNIKHMFDIKTEVAGNYHPLTVLTLAIEYKYAGLKPFLYHFDNLLLHLFNISLISLITWLLTRKFYFTLIVSTLFAIHPMRVESVVWAAERKDVLYAFFFLLAMLQYIRYVSNARQKKGWLVSVYLFFILSLFSKGQAVVLPIVLILIDYWFSGKFNGKDILQKLPFFVLAAFFGYLATQAQASSLTDVRLTQFTWFERILIAAYGTLAYIYKLILPLKLCAFYGYPEKNEWFPVAASLIVLILLFVYLFFRQRKNKVIVFGSLFFLGTIFIVLQLLPVGDAIIADRYTYLPYYGLFFIVGYLGDGFLVQEKKQKIGLIICSCLVITLSVKTYKQSQTWKDSEELYLNMLRVDPSEPLANNNLCALYIQKKDYPRAMEHLKKCIEKKDTYREVFKSYANLGKIYMDQGQPATALNAYSEAIAIQPLFLESYFGRGLAYSMLGETDKAVADFDHIIQISPSHDRAWYSRGLANQNAGRSEEAINDYTKAIEANNNYADAYTNRGNIYFNQGNIDKAVENYNEGIRSNPSDGNIWLNRSKAWMVKSDPQKALADLNQAEILHVSEKAYREEVEATLKAQSQNPH